MTEVRLARGIACGPSQRALVIGALISLATSACGDDSGAAGDASVDSGGVASCRPGETNFDGECADPRTSVKHCGTAEAAVECTAPSDADPVCIDGECSIVCHSGSDADGGVDGGADGGVVEKTACDNVCVDLSSDLENCGACGTACHDPDNGDAICDGACGIACEPGYSECGMECYNLLVDGDHCGDCDTACGNNEVCANGTCVLSCPSGQARCGNSCVDIANDPDNCGGCDNACPTPAHGDPACTNSACGVACDMGYSACDGACVNKKTDENNCGACGKQCSTVNATPTCTNGDCTIVCDSHYEDCDSDVDTGCEVNLAEEETCGGCSTDCTGTGSPFCTDAVTPGTFACAANCGPYTACPATGTPDHCADLTMDLGDCGACGTVCDEPISGDATGDAACASSSCGVDCIAPTDSEVTRGGALACVDSDVDPQACGDTLEPCGKGERCAAGKCVKDQCAPGLTNTDSGCVNLDSDASNCGAPDATCSGIIGLTGCIGQSCFCDLGECRGSCGGSREVCDTRDCVNMASDPAHCGACGNKCAPGQFCKGGTCRDFLYASGAWECGADNDYPKDCASGSGTICVKDTAPCP